MKNLIKNQQGALLVTTIIFSLVLIIAVVAFLNFSKTEFVQVGNQLDSVRAFYIAEAGFQKAMKALKDDFLYTPEGTPPSWADKTLYGPNGNIDLTRGGTVPAPQNYPNFYTLFDNTPFLYYRNADGELLTVESTYKVEISNVPGRRDKIWVRATGRYDQTTRAILILLRMKNISIWNNAIFAGTGQGGALINGNVDIRGSVHLLGDDLSDSDFAMDMSGSGNIGNNYLGMPPDLFMRVPSIAGPDGIEDLETEVRIKNGMLGISGTARVGEPEILGNPYKETVKGVYITDGIGGNTGPENVYSDNGYTNPYDVPEAIPFPRLTEAFKGSPSYIEYLKSRALVISEPGRLAQLANITPTSHFSFKSPNAEISMDGKGNLLIKGIIIVLGDVGFGKGEPVKTIYYSGKGTILALGNIKLNSNLITRSINTYPFLDIIGFMTPQNIYFQASQTNIMGLLYAENSIIAEKQTSVTGTFVSDLFDMGTNVPSIYQVPEIINNMPPGMIGDQAYYWIRIDCWREIKSPASIQASEEYM